MKKYIIIAALSLFMFAACENEIRYKDEYVAPKLIVNSLINIDQENNYVFLYYTGKTKLGKVTDGTVEVTVNGELKETCLPEKSPNDNDVFRYVVKTKFEPGDVVRIDAHAGNNKYHAWAEEVVPKRPILTSIDTMTTAFKDESFYYSSFAQMKFKIGIRDLPNEKNYYRVLIENRFEVSGTISALKDTVITSISNNIWPWDDVVLTDGQPISSEELETGFVERIRNDYGIFRDSRFADSEYSMTVSTSYITPNSYYWDYPGYDPVWEYFIPESMDIYTTVHLQGITESQYYYMNSLNSLGSDYYDDILYDPISVPTNVNGGTGFVGFCSQTSSDKITITKDHQFIYMK